MKTKQIFLLVALMICFQWCMGQNENKVEETVKLEKHLVSTVEPYLTLKVYDKTLKIGQGKLAGEMLNDIKPNWISKIEVWKDQKAIEMYGEEAKDGVLVINFKELSILPKELQDKFNEIKKVE